MSTFIEQQINSPGLSSTHANILFLLLSDLHFYTNNLAVLQHLIRLAHHPVIESNQQRQYLHILYQRLVAAWMLTEATALAEQHTLDVIEALPAMNEEINNFKSLLFFDDNNQLRLKTWHRPEQPHVIVVTNPQCNPSRRFLSWLQHEPRLYSLFEQQSIWLTSQGGYLQQQAIKTHNQNHPQLILNYVYSESAWPEIPLWDTPTLYFFNAEGKLRYQLIGWPTEGRIKELETALKLIDISINKTELEKEVAVN
ncbi:hypothetical protein WG68_12900 [Arsukibacterium ikkense]|uniref:Thioredoxin domain-containing protein n=1 Tax=Arsukibacterium ikkense TaxID=336831 RepID=A0A0M2V3P2_9GAMM|nr:hypothetical protein [Arsukibacterium ikkense]KKO45029.1 hypothetical protein WG68_12900 [Arsukibacterium ikkense]